MLKEVKLPKTFWAEAARKTCYLINQSPSVFLGSQDPECIWIGKDLGYTLLRVFRCKAYVYVTKEQRKKLDDKVVPCISLGYGDHEFEDQLWDPRKKVVIQHMNVKFFEEQFFTIEDTSDEDDEEISNEEESDKDPIPTLVHGIDGRGTNTTGRSY